MKQVLSLCLLVSFISVSLFSYDLKSNEKIQYKIIYEIGSVVDKEEVITKTIEKVDEFISIGIGDENVLDIQRKMLNLGFFIYYYLITYIQN